MDQSHYSAVGFAGHIPGYRDSFGSSYGMTVSRLLSLPPPSCHGQPSTLKGECCYICPNLTPANNCFDPDRYEAPRFHGYMMPGYAGFIPDSHYYFGRNDRFPCQPPFSKLDHNRPRHFSKYACCSAVPFIDKNKRRTASCERCDTCQTECCHSNPGEEPTRQDCYRRCMEEQCRRRNPLASWPYVVDGDTNQHHQDGTMLIPGYSGFVPFKRGVDGLRYAAATKEGLRRFNKCVKEERDTICLPPGPATMKCCSEFVHPNRKIYLEDQGLMNSYTGHLPGHKDRFGEAFSRTTRNLKAFLPSHCDY